MFYVSTYIVTVTVLQFVSPSNKDDDDDDDDVYSLH